MQRTPTNPLTKLFESQALSHQSAGRFSHMPFKNIPQKSWGSLTPCLDLLYNFIKFFEKCFKFLEIADRNLFSGDFVIPSLRSGQRFGALSPSE
jgi:hypothetical protein